MVEVWYDESELRAWVENPHNRRMWGTEYLVRPKLVSEIFGDGRKLIVLTPTMTRPEYYVVRVDSAWNTSNWASEGELLIDHLDDIYLSIELEFGSYDDAEFSDGEAPWPVADFSGGSDWGEIAWPHLAMRGERAELIRYFHTLPEVAHG